MAKVAPQNFDQYRYTYPETPPEQPPKAPRRLVLGLPEKVAIVLFTILVATYVFIGLDIFLGWNL